MPALVLAAVFLGLCWVPGSAANRTYLVTFEGLEPVRVTSVTTDGRSQLCMTFLNNATQPIRAIRVSVTFGNTQSPVTTAIKNFRGPFPPGVPVENKCMYARPSLDTLVMNGKIDSIIMGDGQVVLDPLLEKRIAGAAAPVATMPPSTTIPPSAAPAPFSGTLTQSLPAPQPTLPPEIGAVYIRATCDAAIRTLVEALPLFVKNNDLITAGAADLKTVQQSASVASNTHDAMHIQSGGSSASDLPHSVDADANDAMDNGAVTLSLQSLNRKIDEILKNVAAAKLEAAKLHQLAAASKNDVEKQSLENLARLLEVAIAQQTAIAQQYAGYEQTVELSQLYKGDEGALRMEQGGAKPDVAFPPKTLSTLRQISRDHKPLAESDAVSLTSDTLGDVQNIGVQLHATQVRTATELKKIQQICAGH